MHGVTLFQLTQGGRTALHFACERGDTKVVDLLLKGGADLTVKTVVRQLHVSLVKLTALKILNVALRSMCMLIYII